MSRRGKKKHSSNVRSRLSRRLVLNARLLLLAASLALVVGAIVLAAHFVRIETDVLIDLVTEEVSFVVRGDGQELDPQLQFSRLRIPQCGTVAVEGFALEIPQPDGSQSKARGVGSLRCVDPEANIEISPLAEGQPSLGTLPNLAVSNGTPIILSIAPGQSPVLMIDWRGAPTRLVVPIQQDILISGDLVTPALPDTSPIVSYHARRRPDVPLHAVRLDLDGGGILFAHLVEAGLHEAFERTPRVAVESVSLATDNGNGAEKSALLRNASLTYPNYPHKGVLPVVIESDDTIVLRQIDGAHVERLRVERVEYGDGRPPRWGIGLRVQGTLVRGAAGAVDLANPARPAEGRRADLRLTYADAFTTKEWLAVATSVTFVFGVVISALKFLEKHGKRTG